MGAHFNLFETETKEFLHLDVDGWLCLETHPKAVPLPAEFTERDEKGDMVAFLIENGTYEASYLAADIDKGVGAFKNSNDRSFFMWEGDTLSNTSPGS